MKRILLMATLALACGSSKKVGDNRTKGDTRTQEVSMLNATAYKVSEKATDSTYAYTSENAVKVGGGSKGPDNERYYLNGLKGPNGEKLSYRRVGSCCPFKTPNAVIGDYGMLDKYKVFWENGDTMTIYINMYDKGNLYVPKGLSSASQ